MWRHTGILIHGGGRPAITGIRAGRLIFTACPLIILATGIITIPGIIIRGIRMRAITFTIITRAIRIQARV